MATYSVGAYHGIQGRSIGTGSRKCWFVSGAQFSEFPLSQVRERDEGAPSEGHANLLGHGLPTGSFSGALQLEDELRP